MVFGAKYLSIQSFSSVMDSFCALDVTDSEKRAVKRTEKDRKIFIEQYLKENKILEAANFDKFF